MKEKAGLTRAGFCGEDAVEGVVWAGRPRQGVFFYPHDALRIPFVLLFLVLGVYVYLQEGFLLGLLMAVMAAYGSLGRFLFSALRRRHLKYAIEGRNLVLRSDLLVERHFVLPVSEIDGVGVNCDGGQYGDLIFFGDKIPTIGRLASAGPIEGTGRTEDFMFERIERVFDVAFMIRDLSGGRVWVDRCDIVK